MSKVMLTLKLDPTEADLDSVRRKLRLDASEIDDEFGVVSIRPAEHLYAVLVDDGAAQRVAGEDWVSGPYSNPEIEPFRRQA
ncbi:MAG: hypothetical protein ACJ77A_11030 [Actinomycetota bacterium]